MDLHYDKEKQKEMQKQKQQQALTNMFGRQGYLTKRDYVDNGEIKSDYVKVANRYNKIGDNNLQDRNRLSDKEVKKQKEEFVKKRKKKEGLAMSNKEKGEFENLLKEKWTRDNWMKEKHGKYTNEEILRQINDGDNSNFEKLDGVFRDMVAENFLNSYDVFLDFKDKELDEAGLKEMVDKIEADGMFFNPLFRLGLSQRARVKEANGETSIYRKIDNEIARRIMARTLSYEMNDTEKKEYEAHLMKNSKLDEGQALQERERQEKIEKAKRAQMAKQLLLMHLGKLKVITEGTEKEPDVPMASVLAHCSRTMIITPALDGAKAEDEMWDSILKHHRKGENGQEGYFNDAQIKRRGSSTHSFVRRGVSERHGVEKKKLFNFVRQTGMDVAIGGMGTAGVDGKIIDQDGSCGHVYGMRKKSEKGKNGGYLFGYESDSYGHTNQLGHTHDLKATGEKASSFLSHRVDEIGDKYGGRQADVSNIDVEKIIACMKAVDNAFDNFTQKELEVIADKLTGNSMDLPTFVDFLSINLKMDVRLAQIIGEQRHNQMT